ncbi:uncharacterized protein BO80DRAFT_461731 [Aspergillus ibericus CBS 121593]|uniref:Transcriptional activator of proteases prtT n=1 Tax=Aspergillus ibericus CBS 121593 TaxID=1448316 RepID=A0A395HEK2_9EURO|nr:hypothetical protein BO80DRAFT_461731 [Aspergillus ibericus CBS 121593]RAL04664.1 hypothetical protein BO80DRAFT_461731 [Aspergillus ibericus CBS 121593]
MPPDRGRASRACTSCRKQKTRCYEAGTRDGACLRCERLQRKCSFVPSPVPETTQALSDPGTAIRLERLERTVAALLDRLGEDPIQPTHPPHETPIPSHDSNGAKDTSDAPVIVLRDLADSTSVPDTRSTPAALEDLVDPDLALTLITIFHTHYGKWVLFDPTSHPQTILCHVQKSPLLLSACYLIAVRHTSTALATRLAPKLYEYSRSHISTALLTAPQPLEFFQAALILCLWSTTVGQIPLSIDGWLLSGFALQHCEASPLFGPSPSLGRRFFGNHLCLAHLHYCVGTSRKPMLQSAQITRCKSTVTADQITNYETRMVAEIDLYWTVSNQLLNNRETINILESITELQAWKQEWREVLEQPRSQFLLMGFHFSTLLLYNQSQPTTPHTSSTPSIREMTHHAITIIQTAIDTEDARTRHLTDHIYHMITFAGIVICRFLHKHHGEVSRHYQIEDLDALIIKLVKWLRSIGLSCHIAHKLGAIVEKVYRGVRAADDNAEPSSANEGMDRIEDDELGLDLNLEMGNWYVPDFLAGVGMGEGGWDGGASSNWEGY